MKPKIFTIVIVIWLFLPICVGCKTKPFIPEDPDIDTSTYANLKFSGFTVHIKDYIKGTPEAVEAINLMEKNLSEIAEIVPSNILLIMRSKSHTLLRQRVDRINTT